MIMHDANHLRKLNISNQKLHTNQHNVARQMHDKGSKQQATQDLHKHTPNLHYNVHSSSLTPRFGQEIQTHNEWVHHLPPGIAKVQQVFTNPK